MSVIGRINPPLPPGETLLGEAGVVPSLQGEREGVFDSTVLYREPLSPAEQIGRGAYRRELLYFSDGTRREALLAEPNPELYGAGEISTMPLVGTMPWLFSVRGDKLLENFVTPAVEAGYPVLLLSHEGEGEATHRPTKPSDLLRPGNVLAGIRFARTAHHIHAALDSYASNANFDSSNVIGVMDSVGAVTTYAVVAQAPDHDGRQVVYFDIFDPCHLGELGIIEGAEVAVRAIIEEGVETVSALLHEARSALSTRGGKRFLEALLHTVNLHPASLAGEAAYIPALLSREPDDLLRAMPRDTRGTVTHMQGASLSRASQQSELFDMFPNVRRLWLPGSHNSVARQTVQNERQIRLERLKEEVERANHKLQDINWARIHLGSLAIEKD